MFDNLESVFGAIPFRQLQVDTLGGNFEHENPRRPTGVVNVGVEVFFHQFNRLSLEIAEMILILETPGSDLRPAGYVAKLLLLLRC